MNKQEAIDYIKNMDHRVRSEKRSLAINEIKDALEGKLVKKICNGRIWVVRNTKQEAENDTEV